jgi:DNA-binding transcriptional regulator YiaG
VLSHKVTVGPMNATDLSDLARIRTLVRVGVARDVRIRAGLSLPEVADAVGVSPSTVWRWEHGQRVPRGDAALRYGELMTRLLGSSL